MFGKVFQAGKSGSATMADYRTIINRRQRRHTPTIIATGSLLNSFIGDQLFSEIMSFSSIFLFSSLILILLHILS